MGIFIGTFFGVLVVLVIRKILLKNLDVGVDTLDDANRRAKEFCDNSEMWNLSTFADYKEQEQNDK